MRLINLTQGKVAKVDDDDFEWLSQWKWYYSRGYAVRNGPRKAHRDRIVMHREIAKTPDGMETDHINRDKLDNRKSNLRICTAGQNKYNRPKQRNNTSGYKGVCWDKYADKWKVKIQINGKTKHIGYFDNLVDAARVYDDAAQYYFGDFALSNFDDIGFRPHGRPL